MSCTTNKRRHDWDGSASDRCLAGRYSCEGLRSRQAGTIVDVLEYRVYEVEFLDSAGQTYAARQLIQLLHHPSYEAA